MLLIHGKRTARIKKFTIHDRPCANCRAFDLEIKVFRKYFHLFYIPFIAFGNQFIDARCRNCGQPLRSDQLEQEITQRTKTPLYLYTVPILFSFLIVLIVIANQFTQEEKQRLVNDPKVDDVYQLRRQRDNGVGYWFFKIIGVNGDTVLAHHNKLEYSRYTSKFNDADYFMADDTIQFTKAELKAMLNHDEVNAIERDYSKRTGFNRVK